MSQAKPVSRVRFPWSTWFDAMAQRWGMDRALALSAKTKTVLLLIREEQEAAFMKLLSRLPVAQRSVLVLHFVEDFPLEEIARITDTVLGTVKSRLHYAKRALRKLLEEEME